MPTRRQVLKGGGGVVVAGLAGSMTGAGAAEAATAPPEAGSSAPPSATADGRPPAFRPGGAGPLYWSTYGYESSSTTASSPKTSGSPMSTGWRRPSVAYGYTMVCTDGWIDNTQRITPHGYIVSQADDWTHDWAWWARYLHAKGLALGVYYNPLWVTRSAVVDPSVTVTGRPDVRVADLVNPGDDFDGGGLLQWVDTTRDGAEEYVKGYVAHFRRLGAVFLRIDFLAWYESGFDQSEGTVGVGHGRDAYLRALAWMREAAGDMQLSLVMPNLFDHGSGERRYGDLVRIDNDVSYGTWYDLSGGRQTWQPEWSQWNNPFLGFTGFADISGRGQMILDGDPLIMQTFANDAERQSAINLFTMAGAAIAITDHVDTIGDNAHIFQNPEVLALRAAGLVGKPVFNNSHGFEYDPSSRDPERWIAQLPDGSWAVALFNRDDGPGTRSIDFADVLGCTGPAAVRDLWAHEDLGTMTDYQVSLAPHASVLLSVVPPGPARFSAAVGAWAGSARFDNTFAGYAGLGLCDRPRHCGQQCGHGAVGSQRRDPPAPGPGGQRHRASLDGDRAHPRPGDRTAPRCGHAVRAQYAGLDHLADGATHARHGGRHQSGGVQRRAVRWGSGQPRLRRVGLRSGEARRGTCRAGGTTQGPLPSPHLGLRLAVVPGGWRPTRAREEVVDHLPDRAGGGATMDTEGTETAAVPQEGARGTVSLDADHITRTTRRLDETADRLRHWLARTLGPTCSPVVTDLSSPASNGMSSETVLFTARWDEDGIPVERRLVARIEPPSTAYPVFTSYDLEMQYRILTAGGRAHVECPCPRPSGTKPTRAVLGGPFFVMARVDGLVPPDVLPYTFADNWVFDAGPAERRRLQDSAVEAVAGIHSIRPDRLRPRIPHARPGRRRRGGLTRSAPHTSGRSMPGGWSRTHRRRSWPTASPGWRSTDRPSVGADALSWGDGRIGNMMFQNIDVVAVLDWEMASVAPPEVDLGWMCYLHRFFHDIAVDLGAPGLPDLFRPVDVAAHLRRSARATARSTSPGSWPSPPSGTGPSCAGSPSGPSSSARRPCPTTSTTSSSTGPPCGACSTAPTGPASPF